MPSRHDIEWWFNVGPRLRRWNAGLSHILSDQSLKCVIRGYSQVLKNPLLSPVEPAMSSHPIGSQPQMGGHLNIP